MRQPTNLEVLYKLYNIIYSRENLWKDVACFTESLDYFLIDDTYEKMLNIVGFIEREIGTNEQIEEFKALIASFLNTPYMSSF